VKPIQPPTRADSGVALNPARDKNARRKSPGQDNHRDKKCRRGGGWVLSPAEATTRVADTTMETPMKHFKIATVIGTGAIITGALFGTMPSPVALAACNEGTPNCLHVDGGHKRAQDQVNQGTTVGQCEGPNGFCDDDRAR
jgi:hypothetical protein